MTADRKYQVFVSSTYTDLPEARQALVKALLGLGLIPVGMDLHPTEDNNHWKAIQALVNECDYYLVLTGGRYGTLSPMGLSYTHREYIYAATRKKPVLALLHENPGLLPEPDRETSREGKAKLDDFRHLLRDKASLFRLWNTPGDLHDVITKAMPMLIEKHPAPGWVRAGQVTDFGSQREIQELRKRVAELEKECEEVNAGYRPPIETLARGKDLVTLEYSCNIYIKGDCKASQLVTTMTWDQVFSCVAPQLMDEAPEAAMREALEERIAEGALHDAQRKLPKAHAVRNVVINTSSFNQIKIHLRALGLIRKCSRKQGQTQLTWQLTQLGDRTMTEVLTTRHS